MGGDTKNNPKSPHNDNMDLPDILKKNSETLANSIISSDDEHWMALLRDDVDPFEQETMRDGIKEANVDNGAVIGNVKRVDIRPRVDEKKDLKKNTSNIVDDSGTETVDCEKKSENKTAFEGNDQDDDLGMLWEETKETKGKAKKLIILATICVVIVVLIILSVFFLNNQSHSDDSSYAPKSAKATNTNLITVLQPTIAYSKDGTVIDTTALVSKDDTVTQLTADPETISAGKLGKQKVTYIVTTADGSLEVTKTFTVQV